MADNIGDDQQPSNRKKPKKSSAKDQGQPSPKPSARPSPGKQPPKRAPRKAPPKQPGNPYASEMQSSSSQDSQLQGDSTANSYESALMQNQAGGAPEAAPEEQPESQQNNQSERQEDMPQQQPESQDQPAQQEGQADSSSSQEGQASTNAAQENQGNAPTEEKTGAKPEEKKEPEEAEEGEDEETEKKPSMADDVYAKITEAMHTAVGKSGAKPAVPGQEAQREDQENQESKEGQEVASEPLEEPQGVPSGASDNQRQEPETKSEESPPSQNVTQSSESPQEGQAPNAQEPNEEQNPYAVPQTQYTYTPKQEGTAQQPESQQPVQGAAPGQQASGVYGKVQQGMQVSVTPESPMGPIKAKFEEYKKRQQELKKRRRKRVMKMAAFAIIIVAVIAVVAHVIETLPPPVITTTINYANLGKVSSCEAISVPGHYRLTTNIVTGISSGSCINIVANNVSLDCVGHTIKGSSQYVANSTPVYGIKVVGSSNVSVSDCNVNGFGVGLYSFKSSKVNVTASNFSNNGLSNIYINSSKNGSFINNTLLFSRVNGSFAVVGNSTHNVFLNNTVSSDNATGFYINSRNNTFVDNFVSNTPVSFACGADAMFPISNIGEGNICQVSDGCGFVRCSLSNIPGNVSQVSLAPISINSCGSLNYPGYYNLTGPLNTLYFVNISDVTSAFYPCLNINASNVVLNCNNYTISNSATAIYSSGQSNVRVENCRFTNSSYGIVFKNVVNGTASNIYGTHEISALAMYNSTDGFVKGVKSFQNGYGILLSGTTNTTFADFNTSNNTYGIYVDNSSSNAFLGGTAVSNSKVDVYASINDVNSTSDLMQNTLCTLTNTYWAGCKLKISPNLAFYPETSCLAINRPGEYQLVNNISQAPSDCFNIKTDNVMLNCNGHSVTGNGVGPVVYASGKYNVSVYNCSFRGTPVGVSFSNSTDAVVSNTVIAGTGTAVNFSNVQVFSVTNSTFSLGDTYGLVASSSQGGYVSNNIFSSGSSGDTAILFANSTLSSIVNNSVSSWKTGLLLSGNSTDNYIENNTISSSSYDYYCSGNTVGLGSESGFVNYGTTKHDCPSIAAISPTGPSNLCTSFSSGITEELHSDEVYSAGATCFNIYANNTVLNCNGHTIISDSNGSFAAISGAHNVLLENCYLKGFNRSVIVRSSPATVSNITLIQAPNATSPSISVSDSSGARLSNLNITSNVYGLYVDNLSLGSLSDIYAAANTSFLFNRLSSSSVSGLTSAKSSLVGLELTNSTGNTFSGSAFSGTTGIECLYSSAGKTANINSGGNTYTSSSGCTWLGSSS